MVKRYDITSYEKDGVILSNGIDEWPNTGRYVLYSDYQKVLEALKEALDGWEGELPAHRNHYVIEREERIYQLRSLYLGGGENNVRA